MTEILKYAAETAGIKKIGILSESDFISILPAGGRVTQKYRDGAELTEMSVQLRCKGQNQETLIKALDSAADALTNAEYRKSGLEILNIRKGQLSMPITADEKGNYTYGREIIITYVNRRKKYDIS